MPRTRAMICCTCAPLLLLLLLLERGSVCVAQECDANTPFPLYRSSPPSPYNGIVAISTVICNSNLVCGSSTVLADSTTTPTESLDLNDPSYLRNFATYNSSLRSPNIIVQFGSVIPLSRVDLYFLHYPALNIGLPNLQLLEASSFVDTSGGTQIPYTLINNGNLDSGDREVQRVTLLFNSGSLTRQLFRLDMSFSDLYNTEWFFLSGIRFCNRSPQTLPSGTVTPQTASTNVVATTQELDLGLIDLTCTVSSSGSFEWEWTLVGFNSPLEGGKYTVTAALGGRMSVLTISQLSAEDRGVYQCAVWRLGFASAAMATKEIVLIIPEEPSTTQTLMPENTTQTLMPENTQSLTTESSEDRKPCDTAIALAVVLTLLAAAAVSALIHVAVCICLHQKRAKRDEPAVHDYEMPVQKPCDRAGEDVVYDVIAGEGTERVAMPMDKNKAYGHFN